MARPKRKSRNRLRTRTRKTVQVRLYHGASLLALLVAAVLSLAYLSLGARSEELGREINRLEKRLEAVRRDVQNEEFKWSHLTSPGELEKLFKRHNIVMSWPPPENIVRLRRGDLHLRFAQATGREGHE
ncbi:MAG TPA: hypothetical protein PKE55_04040 [Kiritimatiellia bacterium]|nr:hypothetical protein [Kiritimatiellia bacterium]